jgi:ABC-type glycerol-3-phosphate transport system substrate-binding protein
LRRHLMAILSHGNDSAFFHGFRSKYNQAMFRSGRLAICLLLLTSAAACSAAHQTATEGTGKAQTPVPTSSTPVMPTSTLTPHSLMIWLPPGLSPETSGAAGQDLTQRLQAFEAAHTGLTVMVRTKNESGPAGLLDSLSAADAAAPTVLPDVIALDPASLTAAGLKNLILPLQNRLEAPAEPEWYAFAVQASLVDGGLFGIPLGGETEILAFRADRFSTPPLAWSDLLAGPPPFLFPGGDPQAIFTLAEYLALGGKTISADGRPALDRQLLASVLAFYESGRNAGVIPLSVRQFTSSQDTWAALRSARATSAVSPLSAFFADREPGQLRAIPLPTEDGQGISLVRSWAWAMVARDPARQALAAELIAWLSEPSFSGPWTYKLGLLPPSSTALEQWPLPDDAALGSQLALAAIEAPPEDILATFGPVLHEAVESVLSGAATPEQAAQTAAAAVPGQ